MVFQSLYNDKESTVASLVDDQTPLNQDTECLIPLNIFLENPETFAIPIVNNEAVPVGILERSNFTEFFIKPFTKELYGKKTVSFLMNEQPLIVDINTSLEDISRMIVDAGKSLLLSGYIITVNGKYTGIGNVHDLLSELTRIKQNNLFYLAHFDQLTKLPNRLLFTDRLEKALVDQKRLASKVGLLFIDLDNFKKFNDTLGHNFGDKLLIAFAARLSECAREIDTVARLSGDEFVILLEKIDDEEIVESLATRIVNSMKEPLSVNNEDFFISASVGYAISADGDESSSDILLKADTAMYEAKKLGKNSYMGFKTSMPINKPSDMMLLNELRSAIRNNQLTLYYQPQVEASTGNIIGKEALIRWRHPRHGVLTPIHFIELAEKSGLISEIGEFVLSEAIAQQKVWMSPPFNDVTPMAINISAMQLFKHGFIESVDSIVKHSELPSKLVCFELTESVFMKDMEGAIGVLDKLQIRGFNIAIDDFGTGYSNLSYLKKLPINKLKIDQIFVRNIHNDEVNTAIVEAVRAIANAMRLEVVAEGVECNDELEHLMKHGFHKIQGYIYSKPVSSIEFSELLLSNKKVEIQETV